MGLQAFLLSHIQAPAQGGKAGSVDSLKINVTQREAVSPNKFGNFLPKL
jgi:hypothetical protein